MAHWHTEETYKLNHIKVENWVSRERREGVSAEMQATSHRIQTGLRDAGIPELPYSQEREEFQATSTHLMAPNPARRSAHKMDEPNAH